jgi:hypothetical protein
MIMDKIKELNLLIRMNDRLGVVTEQSVYDQIAVEKAKQIKQEAIKEERKAVFSSMFADLSKDISRLISDDKKKTEEEQVLLDRFANVLSRVDEIEAQSVEHKDQTTEDFIEEIVENTSISAPKEPIIESPIKDPVKDVVDRIKVTKSPSMFVQPDPPPVSRDIRDIQNKLKMLEGWVSKISMTGPGGGAGSVDQLDHRTHVVVSDSYNISRHDYYVGVDYPGNVAVYLPTTVSNGRVLVIKDESGSAAYYPITVVGRVDNDPDGFIIKVNNGAVQLIYSNGWRII